MAGALIGALRVSLSAETSAFEAGMKRSQRTAKATANSIVSDFRGVGGAMNSLKAGVAGFVASLSVGTIIAAGKAALDYAGSLGEISQQLGVTTKDLQSLRYAAGQTGVSQEQLETGLSKLTITLGQVAAGAKAPTEALRAIGVSADELKGKDTGEALRIIADGLAKVEDRSQRAAIEVALFGRSGAKLDNILAGGSQQINALAEAADRLGIVLSDEQIQRADDTADKLEALSTVLKAKIAGEVADNADSILKLADTLVDLVNWAGRASDAWVNFTNNLSRKWSIPAQLNKLINGSVYGFNTPGQSVTVPLGSAKRAPAPRIRPTGPSIPQFLSGGGGGGGRRSGGGRDRSAEEAERKRLEALRDANQFDQEIRLANIDILNAKRALATDEVERYQISVDIKDAERAAFVSQLQYEVAAGERTGVQAEQLQLEYDKKDQLERDLMIAEEGERARRASADVNANVLQMERDLLESQAQLAETASERRAVQLKLLDNAYALQRLQLEEIIASRDATDAQKLIAQQRLDQLQNTYSNDRQAVVNDTRGPMEDYLASLPGTTEKWNEALEQVNANGLQSLEDGLVSIIDGTKSVGEAFKDMADQIIADLIRIMIQKLIMQAVTGGFGFSGGGEVGGGAIGMATGGFVSGPGGPTADRIPAMLSNGEFVVNAKSTRKFLPLLKGINEGEFARMATGGLAIPRASMGERIRMANDNESRRGGVTFDLRGAVMTEDLLRQMNEIGAQAADAGGNLGVKRMRDLNQRTFGRAL